MSKLSYQQCEYLESFFERIGWCGTQDKLDSIFRRFNVTDTEGLDKGFSSMTKRHKWREIWQFCPDQLVCSVTTLALEEWHRLAESPSTDELAGYQRCIQMLKALVDPDWQESEIVAQEVHFANQRELFIADLSKATMSVWVCQYLFNDWKIAEALIAKAKEGLTIDLIIQDNHKTKRQPFWDELKEHSSILWWYPEVKGIMHNKFCIIDNLSIWHGSFNFTKSASELNRECFAKDVNRSVINDFVREYKDIKLFLRREKAMRDFLASEW